MWRAALLANLGEIRDSLAVEDSPDQETHNRFYNALGAARILSGEDPRFDSTARELEEVTEWYNRWVYRSLTPMPSQVDILEKERALSRILDQAVMIHMPTSAQPIALAKAP